MHSGVFLQDLAVVMIVAGLVTIVFHRLRQPVVLGYILAGLIIGPHTPPFPLIRDEHSIETLAELGVILLMFSLGLHFSLRKLFAVGATAIIGASLEIVLMILIGYGIGRAFGWGNMNSLFLGAILSISSTTIIAKALEELGLTKQKFASLVFGILIVEDILAIALLALLSSLAVSGSLELGGVVVTLAKLGIFLTVLLVLGLLLVPPLLRQVARFRSDEMLLITALALCFGVSLLATAFGYSVALGAFLIGAVIAEARESGKIGVLVEPVRDMFSAIFFVAVGMLIDPRLLASYALPIAIITIAVVVGKVLTCSAGAFLAGNDERTSLRVGMSLAQIGEFSFIIAQLGLTRQVTGEFLYPVAVMVSAITTLLTPYLIRGSDPMLAWFDRTAPRGLLEYLHNYNRWFTTQTERDSKGQVRRLLRKWALQLGLNLVLITGLFIVSAWLGPKADEKLPDLPHWIGGGKGLVWLVGALLALPVIIATVRKLRAVAAFVAELRAPRGASDERTAAIRAVVANTIHITGTTLLVLWILLLSSATIPPWRAMIVLGLIIATVAIAMWRSFIRLYAKAQLALTDTLSDKPEPVEERPALMPLILKNAVLETVVIPDNSPAAGKLIRELQLRTATGASVVGIERAGEQLVNPGPDEELQRGDRVLLLGTGAEIDAARRVITA
ncbi:MAG: cation:proton antiporter [Tepidisphaeraceae bacterium]